MEPLVLLQYPGGAGLRSLSPPCVKVQLALKLMELPFEVENAGSPFEVKRRSPSARVPALRIGRRWLAESISILDALEKEFPERSLAPEDARRRAQDRGWDCFVTDTLYWLGFYQRWVPPDARRRMLDETFGRRTPKRLLVGAILGPMMVRRAKAQGVAGLPAPQALGLFVRALDTLVDAIGRGPFLQERDRPGRGDVATAALLVQAGYGDVMVEAFREIVAREALVKLVRRTFEAAGEALPPWWPTVDSTS